MKTMPTKEEMRQSLIKRVGKETQEKFEKSTVAVCGLGGLGSNIAVSLARAGVGNLILIDFDRVDLSNMNRQQYKVSQIGMYKTEALADNLKEIAPYIKLKKWTVRGEKENYPEILKEAQIICEAYDSAEEKSSLVNFVLEHMPEKYLVSGSGMAGMGPSNLIQTRKVTCHFYICGDGVSEVSEEEPLFSPRVMLCAAHEAQAVLRILTEQYDI